MFYKKALLAIAVSMAAFLFPACSYMGIGHKDTQVLMQKYTDENSHFVNIDGIRIHYNVVGQGEPIILIHGFMAAIHTWDEWTQVLQKHYRVYRFDVPGFGLSGNLPIERASSVDDYLTLTRNLINQFMGMHNISSAHIAGNSLGGFIAWNYAVMEPDKVRTVALLDAVTYAQDVPWVVDLAASPITGPFARWFAPKPMFSIALKDVYGDSRRVKPETVTKYHDLAMRKGNKNNFVQVSKIFKREADNPNLGASLKQLKAPTLLMWGGADQWVPTSYAYRAKEALPQATLIIYPGVGHIPMEEVPERSVADYIRFLQGAEVGK